MKNSKYLFLSIFIISLFCLGSCIETFEPTANYISPSSNHLIQGEKKYGDVGGVMSIYRTELSEENERVGFYGIEGFQENSTTVIGELDLNGNVVWKFNLENLTTRDLTSAENGYLFYGSKTISNQQEYFLYQVSSMDQLLFSIQLPFPSSYGKIRNISHIEHLQKNEYLFYVSVGALYYFAVIQIQNDKIMNTPTWIGYNQSLSIFSVEKNTYSNGYDIIGVRTPDIGGFYLTKIKLMETGVYQYWETHFPGTDVSTFYKTCGIKNQEKIYLTGYASRTVGEKSENYCFLHCTTLNGNLNWSLDFPDLSTKGYSLIPYRLLFNNDKLFIIGNEIDFVYSKTNENRGYGAIHTVNVNDFSHNDYFFGSDVEESGINDAFIYGSINPQISLYGYTSNKYNNDHELNDWYIPFNGFQGWYFNVNLDVFGNN